MKILKAEEFVTFYIEGIPKLGDGFRRVDTQGKAPDFKAYKNNLLFAAKQAVKQQHWEMPDGGVFISATVYYKCTAYQKIERLKKLKGFIIPSPKVASSTGAVGVFLTSVLTGIMYKRATQVVGIMVTREYGEEDGLEVVVGTVDTIEEMLHDLQETQ